MGTERQKGNTSTTLNHVFKSKHLPWRMMMIITATY